jgi:hypothetical protein
MIFNLIHPAMALVIVLVFDQFGLSLVGAVLSSAFFAGREYAQAEYKWIERYGDGKRANMKWWNALEPRVWNFHSWFWNLVLPIALAFGFVFLRQI